ncbi:MAG: SPASM domain-containing protein [Thermoprotei archaeon]
MSPRYKEGNVLIDSLKKMWEKGLSLYRKWHPKACEKCPYFQTCQGGCPGRAVYAGTSTDPCARFTRAVGQHKSGKGQAN